MRDDLLGTLLKVRQDILLEGVISLMKGWNDLLLGVLLRGVKGLFASLNSLIREGTKLVRDLIRQGTELVVDLRGQRSSLVLGGGEVCGGGLQRLGTLLLERAGAACGGGLAGSFLLAGHGSSNSYGIWLVIEHLPRYRPNGP